MIVSFPQSLVANPKDVFRAIEEKVEQDAQGIRSQLPDIEREALRAAGYSDAHVSEGVRLSVTVDHLMNGCILASRQGNLVRAMAALRVATELDPARWQGHYSLGWYYLELGRKVALDLALPITGPLDRSPGQQRSFFQAALQHVERACQLNPGHARLWGLLGQIQYQLGDSRQAHAALTRAIALDPAGEGGQAATQASALLQAIVDQR